MACLTHLCPLFSHLSKAHAAGRARARSSKSVALSDESGVARRRWRRAPVANPARGRDQKLGRALETELLFEVRAVRLHRLRAEPEPHRDLFGAEARSEEPKHFELAIGEHLHRRFG